MDNIMTNLNKVSARLSEEAFLSNKGLSNEVGIHVFCYDPADELTVRAYFENLKSQTDKPYHLIECDLYKIFLEICEENPEKYSQYGGAQRQRVPVRADSKDCHSRGIRREDEV